jgi:uncharacterized membrane protein
LNPKSSHWLWLFAPAYLLHAIEELRGVGALHGINLSLTAYVALSSAALLLMIFGIAVAQRFGFPQLLGVCLGTVSFVNGLSHIFNSVVTAGYNAGVISGTLIFIPLGLATLVGLRNSMSWLRYIAGIALGLAIQVIATILAL